MATVLVRRGTLKPGTWLVAGTEMCKIRQLVDSAGQTIEEACPSTPVEISGWRAMPMAGTLAIEVDSEAEAKEILSQRQMMADEAVNASQAEIVKANREAERQKYLLQREITRQEKYRTYIKLMQKKGAFVAIDPVKWGSNESQITLNKTQKEEKEAKENGPKVLNLIVKGTLFLLRLLGRKSD